MKRSFAILLIIACTTISCENNITSSIPSYPVNIEINIAAEYPHFVPANIMQHMIFLSPRYLTESVGYGGVLVVTGLDEQYHAFDLSCPVEAKPNIRIEIDGMYGVCQKCGEKYEVFYGIGNPTEGISREPLRHYTCNTSNGILRINN